MVRLYTAVGRYELKEEYGRKQPVITVNMKEAVLSVEEMLLWSVLVWNILKKDEAQAAFTEKARKAGVDPERFEDVLQRLQVRHLVVSAEAEKGDIALYKLLANLYVVPISSSLWEKIKVFCRLFLVQRVPFSVAKIVFEQEKYTEMERKVLHLAEQNMLSCAEILKCIEKDVQDVSSSEKVTEALYDDDYSTSDNMGLFMWFYDNHRKILEAISTLYLNRNVVFDYWY